jgi:Tn7-like transposition protein D/TniQ
MNHFDDFRITSLAWLPDETLFSLCSRYHRLSKNYKSSSTCQQLFGHKLQGLAHDFPSRIDHFSRITEGILGLSDEIIYRHSILPFYLPLLQEHIKTSAISAMQGEGIGHLKWNLGILTSRFRANHPLKACQKCLDEDIQNHQVSYWHRSHQLPGVWICPIHSVHLLSSTTKSNGVERFFWCLPNADELESPFAASETSHPQSNAALMKLTQSSTALATLPDSFSFDPTRLQQCYLARLKDRGLVKESGLQIKPKELGVQFSEHAQALRVTPELMALPNTVDEAIAFARKMIAPRTGTHPLRHLVWINWLFGDWEQFFEAYENFLEEISSKLDLSPRKITADNPKKTELIRLLTNEGLTITRAAKHLEIDFGTAAAWATKAGIKTPTRPSKMTPEIRTEMIRALNNGDDKKNIATTHDLSITTVTKLLSTEVGLSEAWHQARFRNAQESHREAWQVVIRNNPNLGVKAVRVLEPATFMWLYRHNREWLIEESTKLSKAPRQNHSNVDWDARDETLAQQVKETALQLFEENPCKRILLWMIYQQLPDLKAKLAKLERLPLTKSAITSALTYKQS